VRQEVGIERTYASYQEYNVMLKHFTDFLHERLHRDDITFKDVNFKTISDFADYLLTDGG